MLTMKQPATFAALLIALSSLLPAIAAGAEGSSMKFYKVKEGQITYQFSGNQTGTETFYFADYGNKTRRETHTTMQMGGFTHQNDSILITDGVWMYTIDTNKNQATKMKNPMFAKLDDRRDLDSLKSGEDLMKALGGTIVGDDKVIGQSCKIWDLKQLMMKTCVSSDWLALWTKAGMGGVEMTQTATAVKLGSVPAHLVSLPAGITVVDGGDPMEKLRQQRGMVPSSDAPRRKKGRAPTQEEIEKMQGMQGQDLNQMMEQMKKIQEQMGQKGAQ